MPIDMDDDIMYYLLAKLKINNLEKRVISFRALITFVFKKMKKNLELILNQQECKPLIQTGKNRQIKTKIEVTENQGRHSAREWLIRG